MRSKKAASQLDIEEYKWNSVCVLIDLFNHEMIGFRAGAHKNAEPVYDVFAAIKGELNNIRIHGSLNYMTPVEYRKQIL